MVKYSIFDSVMEAVYHFKNSANLKSLTSRGSIVLFICLSVFFSSCNTAKIYTKPNALSYTTKHKTLAILPPNVKIEVKNSKNISVENNQEQEKTEAINAQNKMYSRLLKSVQKRKRYIEIQDIEKTNAMLSKISYLDGSGAKITPEEIAEALEVDALLFSTCVYSKRKYVGAGIAYALFLFPYGTPYGIMIASMPTHRVDANLKLFDGQTGDMLWNYNKKTSDTGRTYADLFSKLTKKAIKKTPYYRK